MDKKTFITNCFITITMAILMVIGIMAHSKNEIYKNDIRDYEPQFKQVEKSYKELDKGKPYKELDKELKDKKQKQYSETENSYSNQ